MNNTQAFESGPDIRDVFAHARTPRIAIGVPDALTGEQWLALLSRVTSTWGALSSTVFFPMNAWERGGMWDDLMDRFDPDYLYLHHDHPALRHDITTRYNPLFLSVEPALLNDEAGPLIGPAMTSLREIVVFTCFVREGDISIHNFEMGGSLFGFPLIVGREFGYLSEAWT